MDQPDQPSLMSFGEHESTPFCDMVLGHLPHADVIELVKKKYPGLDHVPSERVRYEYAVFQDDEAVLLNTRLDEDRARAVTVVYHRWVPEQDEGQ